MNLNKKREVSQDFFKAANKVISDKRKAVAEAARQQAEADHQEELSQRRQKTAFKNGEAKLNSELGILLNAMEQLPENKNGGKFTITHQNVRGFDDGTYNIGFSLNYRDPVRMLHIYASKHFTVANVRLNGKATAEAFAQCRAEIGEWVGQNAPDRVAELKRALQPKKQAARKPAR